MIDPRGIFFAVVFLGSTQEVDSRGPPRPSPVFTFYLSLKKASEAHGDVMSRLPFYECVFTKFLDQINVEPFG